MNFIEEHHYNHLKSVDEEKLAVHFLKIGRKLMNARKLKEPKLTMFKELLTLSGKKEEE